MATKTTAPSPVDEKKVAVVERRLTKAEQFAADLVIEDDKQEYQATVALSELNKLGDEITGQKEELTKPLNSVLLAIRKRYKPVEEAHANAVRMIKQKLGRYYDEKKRIADAAAAKIAAQAAAGRLRPETAVRKLDEVQTPEKNVTTDAGAVQYRKVPVVTITKQVADLTDAEIVAHARAGYLMWNETAARKAALATGKEGEVFAGVTVTVETQVANIR